MKYYTTNPSERAMSIAKNEAEQQFKKDHDIINYFNVIHEVFDDTLKEFVEQEKEIIYGRNLS
jgi:hypothetical protein